MLCEKPANCRHEKVPHRCHIGDCPPCKRKCGEKLKCGHLCGSNCHDFVLVQIKNDPKDLKNQPQGPWMMHKIETRYERQALPCPPCQEPVKVECLGGHEVFTKPCFEAKTESCYRKCGKVMKCTNHTCSKPCHSDKESCEECLSLCEQPRSKDCSHQCIRGVCHPGKCPPCKGITSKPCYCNQMLLAIECFKFPITDPQVLSCGNRCAKNVCLFKKNPT